VDQSFVCLVTQLSLKPGDALRCVRTSPIFLEAPISAFFDGEVLPTNKVRPISQAILMCNWRLMAIKAYRLQPVSMALISTPGVI
jgi:hypothetical protein